MNKSFTGDCRDVMRQLIEQGMKVQMCVTSPPYWGLRNYGVEGQLGLEETPEGYVANMVEVFSLVRELLADDGTLWLNLGDTYAGSGCGTNDYRTEASKSINKTDKMYSKIPPQLHPDLVRSVRDQCQESRVPFFFKGWGTYRILDGKTHDDLAWSKTDK